MLISIPYTGIHGDRTTINLNPRQIMCVDTIMTSGNPTPNVHVWLVGADNPLMLTNAELATVAGSIDNFYRNINEYCPFMYITKNVFMNVNYVQFVDRPAADPSYDDRPTSIFMAGTKMRIQIKDMTVEDVTNSINAVLKHVENHDEYDL